MGCRFVKAVSYLADMFAQTSRNFGLKHERDEDHMIVDCDDCKVRDIACGDCVVTVLLGAPGAGGPVDVGVTVQGSKIDIDQEELGAIGVLAEVGLVPRLRLVLDSDGPSRSSSLPSCDSSADLRAM